jgi:hypothetical protein
MQDRQAKLQAVMTDEEPKLDALQEKLDALQETMRDKSVERKGHSTHESSGGNAAPQ